MSSFRSVAILLGQGLSYVYAIAFSGIALDWLISPLRSGTFGRWRDPWEPLRFVGIAAIAIAWFRVGSKPNSPIRWAVACLLTILWLGLHVTALVELPDPSDSTAGDGTIGESTVTDEVHDSASPRS